MRAATALLLTTALLWGCGSGIAPDAYPAAPPRFGGAYAMPDRFSAEVVESVLSSGGNAVDAAVAAAFVLAVTLPEAGNIGGGGFLLAVMENAVTFLDYRERAPDAATRDMFLGPDGSVRAGASVVGGLAVAVPGTVAGLWAAHQRYGALSWRELMLPAIVLAERGFEVHPQLARNIQEIAPRFAERTNFDRYFTAVSAGDSLRQPELAATLRRLADSGPEDFYHGETAQLLIDTVARFGGILSEADLAEYEPVWREPLQGNYRDMTVYTAPPPSSGGVALLQLLGMHERVTITHGAVEFHSAQAIHRFAEMQKRVFADRAEYLADSDHVPVPVDLLLASDYLDRRAGEVSISAISRDVSIQPGLQEGLHTTHFSIVDADGNAVSNTYTLNTSFGSGVVVEGAGFLLNNEMDDFSAQPGVPNFFGVVGAEANAIAPGKRPLSSMTPSLFLDQTGVRMVLGAPGGSTIFGTLFQAVVGLAEADLSATAVAGMPRVHHQYPPLAEIRFGPSVPLQAPVQHELQAMGYRVEAYPWDFGDLQLLWRASDQWEAASDPRHRGAAGLIWR